MIRKKSNKNASKIFKKIFLSLLVGTFSFILTINFAEGLMRGPDCNLCPDSPDCELVVSNHGVSCSSNSDCATGVYCLFNALVSGKCGQQLCQSTGGGGTTCTPTSWSPNRDTVCVGNSFTQTSNCGTSQSATGTKPNIDCAGEWQNVTVSDGLYFKQQYVITQQKQCAGATCPHADGYTRCRYLTDKTGNGFPDSISDTWRGGCPGIGPNEATACAKGFEAQGSGESARCVATCEEGYYFNGDTCAANPRGTDMTWARAVWTCQDGRNYLNDMQCSTEGEWLDFMKQFCQPIISYSLGRKCILGNAEDITTGSRIETAGTIKFLWDSIGTNNETITKYTVTIYDQDNNKIDEKEEQEFPRTEDTPRRFFHIHELENPDEWTCYYAQIEAQVPSHLELTQINARTIETNCIEYRTYAEPVTSEYNISIVAETTGYLTTLTATEDGLYAGMYGFPQRVFFTNLTTLTSQEIAKRDAEVKTFSYGNTVYAITQAGKIFVNGTQQGDLGNFYAIAGPRDDSIQALAFTPAQNRIAPHNSSFGENIRTSIPQAGDSTLIKSLIDNQYLSQTHQQSGITVFDMVEYKKANYFIGTGPHHRGSNVGRIFRITATQSGEFTGQEILRSNANNRLGTGTAIQEFEGKLYFGFSYPFTVLSYDGATFTRETIPQQEFFSHVGGMKTLGDRIFVVATKAETGGPVQVYYKQKGSKEWEIAVKAETFAEEELGIAGNVLQAAGLAVFDERLFMTINTMHGNRRGPGYIIEIDGEFGSSLVEPPPDEPIIITNCEELQDINQNLAGHYILGNDIDCSLTREWTYDVDGILYQGFEPIGGKDSGNFIGHLDGNGKSVRGVYINTSDLIRTVGLFSELGPGAIIENISVIDFEILQYGGLNDVVGGIAGRVRRESLINNSFAKGKIVGRNNVGGIAGTTLGTIANSLSEINIYGDTRIGGITGQLTQTGKIINSYAMGLAQGRRTVGGLASTFHGTIINSYSLVHINQRGGGQCTGSCNSCHSGGLVSHTRSVSGTCTFNLLENSYWNIELSGWDTSPAGTGLTIAEMLQKDSYEGWDFENVWEMDDGISFPRLAWESLPEPTRTYNGTGTIADPYQITTCEELQDIQERLGAQYIITENIDCTGITFNPIGDTRKGPFSGSLNGNNKIISNITIVKEDSDYLGIFGMTIGNIKQLTLDNVQVVGKNSIGSLAGFNLGEISNVQMQSGLVTGKNCVGGIVGRSSGVLEDIETNGIIVGENGAGGIAGCADDSILLGYSSAFVKGSQNAGGIVGSAESIRMEETRFNGSLEGGTNTGGVVGGIKNGKIIRAFTLLETITGKQHTGGIAGTVINTNISRSEGFANMEGDTDTGGIAGWTQNANIYDSFSSGSAIGNSNVGGIVGSARNTNVTRTYTVMIVTGNPAEKIIGINESNTIVTNTYFEGIVDETFGVPRTEQELQNKSTFVGWDFENIWDISEGEGMPFLQ